MDNATVIKLLEKQAKDTETLLAAQTTVISARVDTKIEQKMGTMDRKLDAIVAHNETQNGWIKEHSLKLAAHDDDIAELEVDVDAHKRVFRFIRKRWYIIAALFGIVFTVSAWLYHRIDAVATFENKTGIELLDEPR